MAADLFETYAVTVVATMVLAAIFFAGTPALRSALMVYPLAICAVCIVTSIVGTFFVKLGANGSIMGALYKGLIVTGVLSIGGLALATQFVTRLGRHRHRAAARSSPASTLFVCGLVGLVVTGLIVWITEYYTGTGKRPVDSIAQASVTGHGTNVIQGLAVSLESTALPAIVIVGGIISTYQLAGLFGTAIAVTTMLGLAGMIVALDAFGPVTDNAGGIAEMAGLPKEVRQLDRRARRRRQHHQGGHQGLRHRFGRPRRAGAVRRLHLRPQLLHRRGQQGGSTLWLLQGHGAITFDLSNPYVVAGLIFGGLIPYLFGGIAMTAVGRAARLGRRGGPSRSSRRSRASWPGTDKPDYAPRRRHADQGGDQGDDHPVAAAGAGAARAYFVVLLISGSKAVGLRGARRHRCSA